MVSSTSISGLIQCEVGPPASTVGFGSIRLHGHSALVGNSLTPEQRAAFPRPFGNCLVSMPLLKCLVVGAASGEMAQRPTHKTLLLFSLVTAHCLGQAHIKATHCFYFGLGVLPCDGVRQCQPLFLQGCHLSCRQEVGPVLISICLGAGGIPACRHQLYHF